MPNNPTNFDITVFLNTLQLTWHTAIELTAAKGF
jgi:hypothetical protein